MTMPRMGGEEAFRQMHRIDPAVPVILISGFDEQEAVARLEGAGLAGFIQKPYRLQALVAKLREAIAAARPSARREPGGRPAAPTPPCRSAAPRRRPFAGSCTLPIVFMRFLPFFCFSRSLRLRETSPP